MIKPGDYITAYGHTYKVERILYQDYWDRFGYDCEFIDDRGAYHHWKQWDDGGQVLKPEKKYIDCYGTDVTDVFKKYGY